MSTAMAILRWAGVNMNLESVLGSLVTTGAGSTQWLAGFVIHLSAGAAIAWFYAAAFEFAVQSSAVLVGGGLGLSHGLLAGLFMSGIPEMNPWTSAASDAPGAFFLNIAPHMFIGPVLFMLLHVLFGVVVSLIYGEPIQKAHASQESSELMPRLVPPAHG